MILIGVIADVIMPNKKSSNLIKTVVAVITMLIIIKPLASVDLSKINFNQISSNISIDNNFVDLRNAEKINSLATSIEDSLDKNGYKNTQVSFSIDYEKMHINTVFVDLANLVLSDKNLNINKYTNIVAIVQQFVNINQGQVVFNE